MGNALLALIFVSLPLSDDDYKGAALMAAFNVVWTLLFHQNGWMDYAVLVGSNMLLAVYANKIVTEVCDQSRAVAPPNRIEGMATNRVEGDRGHPILIDANF